MFAPIKPPPEPSNPNAATRTLDLEGTARMEDEGGPSEGIVQPTRLPPPSAAERARTLVQDRPLAAAGALLGAGVLVGAVAHHALRRGGRRNKK